jgi:hypothetical protein
MTTRKDPDVPCVEDYAAVPVNLGGPDCPPERLWMEMEALLVRGGHPEWTGAEAEHIAGCSWCRKRWAFVQSGHSRAVASGVHREWSRRRSLIVALAASVVVGIGISAFLLLQDDAGNRVTPQYAVIPNTLRNLELGVGPAVIKAHDPVGVIRSGQKFAVAFSIDTGRRHAYVIRVDRNGAHFLARYAAAANVIQAKLEKHVDDVVGWEILVVVLTDEPAPELERLNSHLDLETLDHLQDASAAERGRLIPKFLHERMAAAMPTDWRGTADDILLLGVLDHQP